MNSQVYRQSIAALGTWSTGLEQPKFQWSGQACTVARGVWGHAPLLDVLRAILMRFGTLVYHGKVHVQIDYIDLKRIVFIKIESPIIHFRMSCSIDND